MHANERDSKKGFSLVEILVVIGIIGVLSVMAVVAVNYARGKARESRARGDLAQMRTAVQLLEQDTGKWPNGCPPWSVKNPEVYFSAASAGIAAAPTVANNGDGCIWNADEVAKWKGPYSLQVTDPWGHDYYFDPDYTPYQNCGSKTTGVEGVFLVSFGPNGAGPNAYDCDDIFLKLR